MVKKIQEPQVKVTDEVYNRRSLPTIDTGNYSGYSSSTAYDDFDVDNYYTKDEIDVKLNQIIQFRYTAGDNITIDGSNVISSRTYYSNDFELGELTDSDNLMGYWNSKQDELVAGDNVNIEGDTISVTIPDPDLSNYYNKSEINEIVNNIPDTTYSAGSNITIDANNEISADLSDYYSKTQVDTKLSEHDYSAGSGIQINNRVISTNLPQSIKQVDLNNYITSKSGEIVQNIGSTSEYYDHGYIYEKVGNNWVRINVQPVAPIRIISASSINNNLSNIDTSEWSDDDLVIIKGVGNTLTFTSRSGVKTLYGPLEFDLQFRFDGAYFIPTFPMIQ